MKALNIRWETDGHEVPGLPTEVDIPSDIDEEEITDYLSDTYGFLIQSYSLD